MAKPNPAAAAVEKIKKAGVAEHLKQAGEKAWRTTAEASAKALAFTRASLAKAKTEANFPQLAMTGAVTVVVAPFAAAAQTGINNATASMVVPTADGTGYESTFTRKLIAWGSLPLAGAAVAGAAYKWGKKNGHVAAGGIGLGLGLAVGSIVSSMRTPLVVNPPVEMV